MQPRGPVGDVRKRRCAIDGQARVKPYSGARQHAQRGEVRPPGAGAECADGGGPRVVQELQARADQLALRFFIVLVQQGPRELRQIPAARIGEPLRVEVEPDLLPCTTDRFDDLDKEPGPEAAREERVDEVGRSQPVLGERLELVRQPPQPVSLATPEVCCPLALARFAGWEGRVGPPDRPRPNLRVDGKEHAKWGVPGFNGHELDENNSSSTHPDGD